MMMPLRKNSPLIKIIKNAQIDHPSPSNVSTVWNFGSLLGICLMIQILTGIFLAMHYCPAINYAFSSVSHICRDINYGWLIRTIHANGASMFFICLYIHVGRGFYYSSFKLYFNFINNYSNSFFSMCTSFSTNIMLSSYSNY